MPNPFEPSDLLKYRSVASIVAANDLAACVIEQPDEASDANSSNVWLVPLNGGEPKLFTAGMDSAPSWSPDGRALAFVSGRGGNGLQAYVMRVDGGEARCVTSLKGGVSTVIWSPDGQKLLVTAKQEVDSPDRGERGGPSNAKKPYVVWRLPYKSDGIGYILSREVHLFLVDRQGGEAVQLTDGPFDVRSARFSPDGSRIVYTRTRTGREAHRTDVWVMDANGDNAEQLTCDVASAQFPFWSPDGNRIVFTGSDMEGDSLSRLWLIDLPDKSVRPLGKEGLEVESGDSVHWSEDSSEIFFIRFHRGLQDIARIRVADEKVDVVVSSQRHILKFALASDRLVYAATGLEEPTEIFTAARDGSDEIKLTDLNGWWRERQPPRASIRSFTVPDGEGGEETIEGWLMLPPDGGKGPFPLLIDVHGGPQSVAFVEIGKTLWRHVLCGRGWAVLALNPVGSNSYGEEFMMRIRNNWGKLDLPQHLAAIEALQREGIADDRLAIYGKSYGGYLSAWAITQTHLFRAAVVSAPVANIQSHFGTSDTGFYVTPYAMRGEPYVDKKAARDLSPLEHMHHARTPTLLLQGMEDYRCPIGQSEEIFVTLMRSGEVATEMVLYPGGDHHVAEEGPPSFRIDYVTRIVDWVERWANGREGDHRTNPGKETQSSSGG